MKLKNRNIFVAASLFLLCSASIISSCHKDEPAVDLAAGGFPNAVGKIILGKLQARIFCKTALC